MSTEHYIALPKVPKTHEISDYEGNGKKAGLYHGSGYVSNKHYKYYVYLPLNSSADVNNLAFSENLRSATFNDCFKNPFVFTFFHGMMPNYREEEDYIYSFCQNPLNSGNLKAELEKFNEKNYLWKRQVLYEALDIVLDDGEVAELYIVSTNHVDFDFGPPASERVIELRHLLSLKNALNYPNNAAIFDTESGYKLTIVKTNTP